MRSVSDTVPVRLYFLDEGTATATTLMYGTLAQALSHAAAQPDDVQAGLFLQTENDVIAYLDQVEG